jgi:glutaconyl-CoA decarboxylase
MKKQLRISVNGQTFNVVAEVVDEGAPAVAPLVPPAASSARPATPPPAPTPAAPAPTASSGAAGEVQSPLAGKVVSIDKAVGTAVKAGDVLMTLEAMKMNTSVTATDAGTVSKVLVSAGDSVEEGQPLLIIS